MAELARQWIDARKTLRRCVIFRPIIQIGDAEDGKACGASKRRGGWMGLRPRPA